MNSNLPDGAQVKISYQNSVFERSLFAGYLLGFEDCVPISPESREKAIADDIADIVLVSVSKKGIEIENIKENKVDSLSLGDKISIFSTKYGTVEITLLGVRVGADESNFDQWITAESRL